MIRKPWPSMLRTIWGDNERYLSTYWERFHGRYYVAGDSAHRDADGYFWIMGRIDDVLKVSGHRLGTMEIESALVANPTRRRGGGGRQGRRDQGRIGVCIRGAARSAARRATAAPWSRSCATGSASSWEPSPSPTTSALPTTCPRPAPARSCAGCCARSPTTSRSRRTSRRSKTPPSSISCAASILRGAALPPRRKPARQGRAAAKLHRALKRAKPARPVRKAAMKPKAGRCEEGRRSAKAKPQRSAAAKRGRAAPEDQATGAKTPPPLSGARAPSYSFGALHGQLTDRDRRLDRPPPCCCRPTCC